ncbi:MAG: hypothetical protein M1370_11340 [Bacteroidetes bacterium]|nr:hypothetical protein [Bacteroidota bacterium]
MTRKTAVLVAALASAAALTVLVAGSVFAQTPNGGWGPGGMMGGFGGYGPGGGWGMGGMMGGWWGGAQQPTGNPISVDQAQQDAQQAISSYGDQNLAISEIMEFQYNFYVEVKEKDTGVHAFELLVNRYSGAVYPEPGPNMMWNTKYGMMGRGMMGGFGPWSGQAQQPTATMPVTADQAIKDANAYLAQAFPGAQSATDPSTFYGYYTMDFSQGGKTVGMLSVNGYTGQVWYHTWHGTFVSEKQIGS